MSDVARYVVGFVGKRDYYQVPVALYESGRLELLATDFYLGERAATLARWIPRGRKASGRRDPRLPAHLVQTCGPVPHVLHRVRSWRGQPSATAVRPLSQAIARLMVERAASTGARLFVYNFDLVPVVREMRRLGRRLPLVIFQAHPSPRQARLALQTERERSQVSTDRDADELLSEDDVEEYERAMLEADALVAASTYVLRGSEPLLREQAQAFLVPYGADFDARLKGRPEPPAPARDSSSRAPLRMLWVGQLAFRKGYTVLFDAIRLLRPGSVELTMVCRPAPRGSLQHLVPPGVKILSELADGDLRRVFAEHDVFVMPSLVEGFGLVYLEAMAEGLPVVGTANSGLPDLITPGREGVLIPPSDPMALATAIDAAASDRVSLSAMGRAARVRAHQYTWASFRTGIQAAAAKMDDHAPD